MESVTEPIAVGRPVELGPGVIRLTAPNPGIMTGPGTNTYIVGGAGHHSVVIDPGPAMETHLDAILSSVREVGSIVVTHTHIDHAPGAASLSQRTGAPVLGFAPSAGFHPDSLLKDGDVLSVGSLHLRAIHTPGHASDHLCYLLEEHGMLFSGDHVMQGSTVVIAPPDGDMGAYMASLQKIADLAPPLTAIAPGHGLVINDPLAAIGDYIRHRQMREAAILAVLQSRPSMSVDDIVPTVYTDVNQALHPIARMSVWAHLRKLAGEGYAFTDDPNSIESPWSAAAVRR